MPNYIDPIITVNVSLSDIRNYFPLSDTVSNFLDSLDDEQLEYVAEYLAEYGPYDSDIALDDQILYNIDELIDELNWADV